MPEPDAIFADPRLAAVYDAFDGPRDDLAAYVAIVEELGARSVLDIGCGTGELALLLAAQGIEVTGLDPAPASLDVARAKEGAAAVTWVAGDLAVLPPMQVDLAVMTGNVAQVFVGDHDWYAALRHAHAALRPGGHLVFETRVPADRAWERWTPEATTQRQAIDGAMVTTWTEVLQVAPPLVLFRHHYRFEHPASGAADELSSDSTLRFRELTELEADLTAAGLEPVGVREALDRPGREYVVVARRPIESL